MGRRSTLCTPVPVRFRQNAAATTLKHGPAPFDWTRVALGHPVLCLAVAFISVPAFGVALSVPPWLLLLQRNKLGPARGQKRDSARTRERPACIGSRAVRLPLVATAIVFVVTSFTFGGTRCRNAEMQKCQSLSTRTDSRNLRTFQIPGICEFIPVSSC